MYNTVVKYIYGSVVDLLNLIMRKCICILVVFSFVFSISCVSAMPNDEKDICNKVSDELQSIISNMNENDNTDVYIWYDDIDQDFVTSKTVDELNYDSEEISYLSNNIVDENDDSKKQIVDEYIDTRRVNSREIYKNKADYIIKKLNIQKDKLIFVSEYAPMIIANLDYSQLNTTMRLSFISKLGVYKDSVYSAESIETANRTTNVETIREINGLTGKNVKVGIIENSSVHLTTNDPNGIVPKREKPIITDNHIGSRYVDYGNVVIVGDTPYNAEDDHVNAVAKTLLSVSPDVTIYSGSFSYHNIELMISAGVKILTCSIGDILKDTDDDFAYTLTEKWVDHISEYHSVLFVKSAGNNIGNENKRISSPGLAYNAITVGAYYDCEDGEKPSIKTDSLYTYSCYKNSVADKSGCEKPDVVMPATFNGGGTSNAAPYLAGTIALMYELNPAISNEPCIMKAIVLASCHRKVTQYEVEVNDSGFLTGKQETMEQGLTDRQGAGAPDAFTMAGIISQGTYGYGIVKDNSSIVFYQPKGDGSFINVSITWQKELEKLGSHETDRYLVDKDISNLDMRVLNGKEEIKKSCLTNSSSEMCYFAMKNNNNYKVEITGDSNSIGTKYAYAWSTDESYLEPIKNDAVFYLKNQHTGQYLEFDDESLIARAIDTEYNNLSMKNMWLMKEDSNDNLFEIKTCSLLNEKGIFGQQKNSEVSLQDLLSKFNKIDNKDGTVSFVDSNSTGILSCDKGKVSILDYNDADVSDSEKWVLEKVNIRKGDVNIDGQVDIKDATKLLKLIKSNEKINGNILKYLSDVNYDGVVDQKDYDKLVKIINHSEYF